MLYPATALVIGMPLAILSMHGAALVFTFVGSAVLAYGITRDSWHRLPMLLSAAFVDSALGAQWSPLLVASIFIPALACFASAKPQLGVAVLSGVRSRQGVVAAAIGAIFFLGLSLVLEPGWISEWLQAVSTAEHMRSPILQPPGFLIPLVLLRWRRPEAWVIFLSACLPMTLMWYSFLVLLAFPRSYREACVLSVVSSLGYGIVNVVNELQPHDLQTGRIIWGIVVCTTFLPAVISVLRRAVPLQDLTSMQAPHRLSPDRL